MSNKHNGALEEIRELAESIMQQSANIGLQIHMDIEPDMANVERYNDRIESAAARIRALTFVACAEPVTEDDIEWGKRKAAEFGMDASQKEEGDGRG